MKLDSRTLVYLILVVIIALLIFVPLIQATREGYCGEDYYTVSDGYVFQENVVRDDQTQAFGCGC